VVRGKLPPKSAGGVLGIRTNFSWRLEWLEWTWMGKLNESKWWIGHCDVWLPEGSAKNFQTAAGVIWVFLMWIFWLIWVEISLITVFSYCFFMVFPLFSHVNLACDGQPPPLRSSVALMCRNPPVWGSFRPSPHRRHGIPQLWKSRLDDSYRVTTLF
jgi:hypothetical protein